MIQRLAFIIAAVFAAAPLCPAQNSNTSAPAPPPPASRPRTQTSAPSQAQQGNTDAQTTDADTRQGRTGRRNNPDDPSSKGVVDAFDSLIAGIEKADVALVTNVYWNSSQLILFNFNGTVTRTWEQMRKNRESSYPNLKDVHLVVRDVRTQMLGRDGAVVTCLWTQSQNFRGTPETASGRMTLVFRRTGTTWKAVHLHTSPDAPDATRVLPSEQTTEPTPPAPKPTPKPGGTP